MLTYDEHMKEPKLKYRFFDDFSMIASLSALCINKHKNIY